MSKIETHGWTLKEQQRKTRDGVKPYFVLVRSKPSPTTVSLSVEGVTLTRTQAENALRNVRAITVAGQVEKILKLYDTPDDQRERVSSTGLSVVGADDEQHGDFIAVPDLSAMSGKARAVHMLVHDNDLDEFMAALRKPSVDLSTLSVSDYWRDIYWPCRTGKKPDAAVRVGADETIDKEDRVWRLINASALGRVRLKHLDAWIFQAYLDGLVVRRNPKRTTQSPNLGKPVSPRTKAIHRSAYQAMLNFAHRKGHLRTKHEFFPIFGAATPSLQTEKEDPLSIDEVARLFEAETDPMRRAMWGIAIGQGLRPSELSRVEWADILTDGTMQVRGSKTATSYAVVPMTPIARTEVDRYRATLRRSGVEPVGLMFTCRRQPITDYGKALVATARLAGIERRVHPYLLRATFATICHMLGISKDDARVIGRWTDTKMLDRVYCRPRPADLVGRLAAFALPETTMAPETTDAAITEDHWLRLMS